jgi:hypothetical protein
MDDFDAELWLHQGQAAWYFLTVPEEVSDAIEARAVARRGFGSVRVRVTVGATRWSTSVFPDRKRGTYVLPVKRAVRQSEGLTEGSRVRVRLEVLEGDVFDGLADGS